ncbi:MAG: hypothetical protein WCC53_01385 [Thermoanaerobaculia bacterium]
MRAFAAVFAREIAERRMVFLVGICSGLLSVVAAALHGWNAPGSTEVRLLVATVGGGALAAALALLFGASMIAGETAEKRISFYYSRPLPDVSIWAGKLLAAVFLSFSAGFLVFLPGWLTGPARASTLWGFETTTGRLALAAVALVTSCVLGSHAVVTIARLRSPWVVLDLILAPALVLLAAAFLRSLLRNGLFGSGPFDATFDLVRSLAGLAAVVLAALAAASGAQVAAGRTDARRSHGVFSVALWGILVPATAALGGYAGWVASADATDLVSIQQGFLAAPRGPWVAAGGPVRAARGGGSFLFDASRGRSIRVRGYDAVFSQDGMRAAWGEPEFGFFERKSNRAELMVADLATGRVVGAGIETAGWAALAFSPSGRRLAVRDGQSLAAYDVSDPANPRQLAAFPVAEGSRGFAFVDEDTVRLFPRFYNTLNRKGLAPPVLEVVELSLPSKQSLVTGRFDRETLPFLHLSADARFLVGTRRLRDDPDGKQALTLHDGRTGALLATLAEDFRSPQARFLSGNRIVIAGITGATARVVFFEGEKGWGAPSLSVDLGKASRVVLGGEIAAGRVVVSLLPFEDNLPASRRAARLAFVDAATGVVASGPDGLVPANRFGWWFNAVLPPAEAGSPSSTLFLDAEGRLVRFDLATGTQTVLLGKGK